MRTLGWGLFLASSWTWCIGMYLPVIVLREYGWLGFLLFAIPNVAGCVLFAWTMPPARSRALLERGVWLARAFSVVTIAYHLFFVGFVVGTMPAPDERGGWAVVVAGVALVLAAASLLARAPARAWPLLGSCAWVISACCFLAWLLRAGPEHAPAAELAAHPCWTGTRPWSDLFSLGWPILFGFLWSPWFDLTFHRARAEGGGGGAFAIFGAAFALMLLFTAAYAPDVGALGLLVLVHLAVQSIFTVAAHLRELRATPRETLPGEGGTRPTIPRNLLLVLIVAGWAGAALLGMIDPTEAGYLRFLVFYGLLVPALGLLALASPTPGADRRRVPLLLVLLVSIVLLELAFNRGMPWLAWIPFALLALLFAWRPAPRPLPATGHPVRPATLAGERGFPGGLFAPLALRPHARRR